MNHISPKAGTGRPDSPGALDAAETLPIFTVDGSISATRFIERIGGEINEGDVAAALDFAR